ncbi:MAG: hypothetical protein AVDCRST_MAG02-1556, partial [uncultured Rubrobacteraceae bacterium]
GQEKKRAERPHGNHLERELRGRRRGTNTFGASWVLRRRRLLGREAGAGGHHLQPLQKARRRAGEAPGGASTGGGRGRSSFQVRDRRGGAPDRRGGRKREGRRERVVPEAGRAARGPDLGRRRRDDPPRRGRIRLDLGDHPRRERGHRRRERGWHRRRPSGDRRVHGRTGAAGERGQRRAGERLRAGHGRRVQHARDEAPSSPGL